MVIYVCDDGQIRACNPIYSKTRALCSHTRKQPPSQNTKKNNRGSASEEDFDEASPTNAGNGGANGNGGVGQKGEEEADAVMSHLVLDDRTWFLAEAFRVGLFVCIVYIYIYMSV